MLEGGQKADKNLHTNLRGSCEWAGNAESVLSDHADDLRADQHLATVRIRASAIGVQGSQSRTGRLSRLQTDRDGRAMKTRGVDEAISQAWRKAGTDLGIRVTAPFAIRLSAGEPVIYEAHILDFGGPKGTVVGVLDDELGDYRAIEGYYSSNLSISYRTYTRQQFIGALNDWGWYGPAELRPSWYTGESWTTYTVDNA